MRTNKYSSFFYPSKRYYEEYKRQIENINHDRLRVLIKIEACCGYRIGEVLNSYLFEIEGDNNIYIRSPAFKTSILRKLKIKFSGIHKHQTNFIGKDQLSGLLRLHSNKAPIFKSNSLKNFLGLDLDEIKEYTTDFANPKWFLAEKLKIRNYNTAYKLIKKELSPLPVFVKLSDFEEPVLKWETPSFHFFRKLYAILFYQYSKMDFIATLQELHWKDFQRLLDYIKTTQK